jgi:Na+-driven multidrug efflux pump
MGGRYVRAVIFLIIPLLILPWLMGVDGVWMSMPVAEVMSILLSVFYFKRMKSKYRYA